MEDTMIARLCRLDVGESEAMVERIAATTGVTFDQVSKSMNSMTATLRNAGLKANARTGYNFETTRGEFRAKNGDLVITAVITRTGETEPLPPSDTIAHRAPR